MPKLPNKKLRDILTHYGLKAHKVRAIQDNVFQISTDQGEYCLKQVHVSPKKLNFMVAVQQHLARQGFRSSANNVPTLSGAGYFESGGELYLLTAWLKGVRCDFRLDSHLKAAAETLAVFHLAGKGLESLPAFALTTPTHAALEATEMWEQWPAVYQARVNSLRAMQAQAAQKRKPSTFDRLFLEHYDSYMNDARQALQSLGRSQYRNVAKQAKNERSLVHRDVAARNFIIGLDRQAYLIDFDYCRYDLRVTDLVRLIQRTLKHLHWAPAKALEILAYYHAVNPLTPEEYPIMLAMLQFPQKFWRLADRYYGASKGWSEGKFTKKLKRLLKQQAEHTQFLQYFARYCLK